MANAADFISFRQTKPEEVDIFVDFLERAALWMEANNLNQWTPGSFVAPKTRAHIEHTVALGNAYFIVDNNPTRTLSATAANTNNAIATPTLVTPPLSPLPSPLPEQQQPEATIIGTLTLNYSDPFDEMLWKDLVDDWTDAVYLHRLFIEREYRGCGLGPKALMFAEQEGLKRGKHYLRLDCMADNKLLKAYYREKAHFQEFDDYAGERLFGRFERPITSTLPVVEAQVEAKQ
ncbi:hypothetical protein BGZ99_001008 [Dissophora globulifera]|uniref:N-acetyltransferase domain-containing protein n=1 Tax=Dissophora globulifera TaxID=979702 RepID=A0A9P6RP84_9FUNG|nr:hypothetical protein BGZ99_001008 [Dissophora globulifera]